MRLGEKQELFARLLPRLLDKAHELGFTVRLGEVLRFEQQAEYNATHCRECKSSEAVHSTAYAKSGGKKADHAFRPIGIRDSLHCKKLAIDIILFRNGNVCWDRDSYEPLHDYWESLHELCARRIRWDAGHFSITHGGKR